MVLRVAVGDLAVRDRRLLEEPVDVRAVGDVAGLLVEVAPQAEVPIAEREDRLVAGRIGPVEGELADAPGIDGVERALVGHHGRRQRSPEREEAGAGRDRHPEPEPVIP